MLHVPMPMPAAIHPPAPERPEPAWPDAAPPAPAQPIVGRDPIVADLVESLIAGVDRRILLSGLGGVGKTRLAIEIADDVAGRFDGRVAWLPLARVSRDGGLASALAAALELDGGEPDHLPDAIAAALGDRPALLVLDAVESVLHDLRVVDELAALNADVRIVMTSRIGFDRRGVRAVAVEPLRVPKTGDDADRVAASPAVQLLVDR